MDARQPLLRGGRPTPPRPSPFAPASAPFIAPPPSRPPPSRPPPSLPQQLHQPLPLPNQQSSLSHVRPPRQLPSPVQPLLSSLPAAPPPEAQASPLPISTSSSIPPISQQQIAQRHLPNTVDRILSAARSLRAKPVYNIQRAGGQDHHPLFHTDLTLVPLGYNVQGVGRSKMASRRDAAGNMLNLLYAKNMCPVLTAPQITAAPQSNSTPISQPPQPPQPNLSLLPGHSTQSMLPTQSKKQPRTKHVQSIVTMPSMQPLNSVQPPLSTNTAPSVLPMLSTQPVKPSQESQPPRSTPLPQPVHTSQPVNPTHLPKSSNSTLLSQPIPPQRPLQGSHSSLSLQADRSEQLPRQLPRQKQLPKQLPQEQPSQTDPGKSPASPRSLQPTKPDPRSGPVPVSEPNLPSQTPPTSSHDHVSLASVQRSQVNKTGSYIDDAAPHAPPKPSEEGDEVQTLFYVDRSPDPDLEKELEEENMLDSEAEAPVSRTSPPPSEPTANTASTVLPSPSLPAAKAPNIAIAVTYLPSQPNKACNDGRTNRTESSISKHFDKVPESLSVKPNIHIPDPRIPAHSKTKSCKAQDVVSPKVASMEIKKRPITHGCPSPKLFPLKQSSTALSSALKRKQDNLEADAGSTLKSDKTASDQVRKKYKRTLRQLPTRLECHVLCLYSEATKEILRNLIDAELFITLRVRVLTKDPIQESVLSLMSSGRENVISSRIVSGDINQVTLAMGFEAGKACHELWINRAKHLAQGLPLSLSPRMIILAEIPRLDLLKQKGVIDVFTPSQNLVLHMKNILGKAAIDMS